MALFHWSLYDELLYDCGYWSSGRAQVHIALGSRGETPIGGLGKAPEKFETFQPLAFCVTETEITILYLSVRHWPSR